ncbi:MAG: protease modulator HflC [wastewater metagenome]|nr:protease modulator HflC [Candidatus Loosdrechtia aerotolerans]
MAIVKYVFILIIVFFGLFMLNKIFPVAFVVDETEQVVVTQFGKPVGKPITEPGIYLKIPFIQKVHFFDKRFLEWDGDKNQVPTKDKRFIWVDTYARWRISDPLLFFQRVYDERGAQSRLDDILDGETRNAIASHNLVEIIRTTDRNLQFGEDYLEITEDVRMAEIKYGREKITMDIVRVAAERTKELGIELLDLRLKRLIYVKEVQDKIFDRMITERKRIADKYRSEGKGEAAKIIGSKERELKRIQSEAYRTAQEIIGKADAEATEIFAAAYNQSPESREYYKFLKTLETYEKTLKENDWLILSTESDVFQYLQKQTSK